MDGSKIKYYKQLVPLLQQIQEEMDKTGRGFVFTTLPKDDGNGQARPLSCVRLMGENEEDMFIEFWAGLMALIEAFNKEIPEDLRPMWRDTFTTFIQATAKLCFPHLHFERVDFNGKQKKGD